MIPGIYKGKVVEAVLAQTEKGQEYIGITFEVTEGEHAGSCITSQQWWTPNAEPYTRATLQKLGWEGEVRTVDDQVHLVLPSTEVPFCVREEEYKGRVSLKIDWIVAPPAGVRESDKLTGKRAASLLARLKGEKPASNYGGNGNGGGYGARSNGYTNNGNGYANGSSAARREYGPGADDDGI